MSTRTRMVVGVIVVLILVVAFIAYLQAIQPTPQSTPSPAPTTSPTKTPSASLSPTPTSPQATPTPSPSASSSPTPSLPPLEQETVRDLAMNFIKTNHPETTQFMKNLIWTGGRATADNVVGAETYIYYAGGWNVTIAYPVVPQALYKITADYKAQGISIPVRIIWEGTWQNQIIKETNYVFAQ